MGIKKIVARWVYFRKMARLYRYAPFLLLSRSTVYRVDYVATINFANGTDPRRGEDQSIPRKSSKIFPRCDTEQMRRIEHDNSVTRIRREDFLYVGHVLFLLSLPRDF